MSAITRSQGASTMKAVESVSARLELSTSVKLVAGTAEVDRGHLSGWSDRNDECTRFSRWGAAAKRAQWVVRGHESARRPHEQGPFRKAGGDVKDVTLDRSTKSVPGCSIGGFPGPVSSPEEAAGPRPRGYRFVPRTVIHSE
jgi:hypothetical protein